MYDINKVLTSITYEIYFQDSRFSSRVPTTKAHEPVSNTHFSFFQKQLHSSLLLRRYSTYCESNSQRCMYG